MRGGETGEGVALAPQHARAGLAGTVFHIIRLDACPAPEGAAAKATTKGFSCFATANS
jgi:hypothetical protein